MDSFFYRFRNPLVLIAIVLMQVIALAMQVQRPSKDADVPASARAMEDAGSAPDGKHVSLLRRWMVTAVTPLETAVHGSSVKVRGAWGNYVNLVHTRQQDAQLKSEVARLREEEASFAEDAAQGRRLQTLLGFKESYVTSTVAAQVIGTSGSERSHVLYIDKGSEDGIKPEMAVITPDGVVGKIRDVFPRTSQLLLISDSSSGAGVILATTRIRGIVKGTATGRVEIDNLTADSRIKVVEMEVTSGGDLGFPRGLPVGTNESIAPDPLHQPYTAICDQDGSEFESAGRGAGDYGDVGDVAADSCAGCCCGGGYAGCESAGRGCDCGEAAEFASGRGCDRGCGAGDCGG